MTKTKRQLILEDFEVTLKELRETKSAVVSKTATSLDFKDMPYDSYVIMPGRETRIQGAIGRESYIWDIDIECYTKDEPEQKLKSIYNKIMEDKLRNNNTDDTIKMESDYWMIDEDEKVWGIVLTFSVLYNHPIGQM